MTIAVCSLIATTFTGSGAAVLPRNEGGDARGRSTPESLLRVSSPLSFNGQDSGLSIRRSGFDSPQGRCTYAQHRFLMRAIRFYSWRIRVHEAKMGLPTDRTRTASGGHARPVGGSPCPRFLAKHLRLAAYAARARYDDWRTLRDFPVREGSHAWLRAVQEAQKPFPGTKAWLLSCSASEGGWGRWVPNSGDSGSGGWMQFMEGTFWRMFSAARSDVRRRGFRVPASAASWYSPIGQALAGAWGVTHGRSGEWYGRGC